MKSRRRTGAAEIIGTVFALLIVFTVVFAGILTSYQLQNNYTSTVLARRQMDFDQESESFAIETNPLQLNYITFVNTGPITTAIAELFVRDLTENHPPRNFTINPPLVLNPGASGGFDVPSAGSGGVDILRTKRYLLTAFTQRGSKTERLLDVPSELARVNASGLTGVIGPLLLEFGSLNWNSTNPSLVQGQFAIPAGQKDVYWSLTLTNMGNETITLNSTSAFLIVSASLGQGSGGTAQWYLHSSVTLEPAPHPQSRHTLHFWRQTNGSSKGNAMPGWGTYAVFVTLVGYYPNRTDPREKGFAETIPFQSVCAWTNQNPC